jgi:hypothetical protein
MLGLLLALSLSLSLSVYAQDTQSMGSWNGNFEGFKYRIGDNPAWSKFDVSPSNWKAFDRDVLIEQQGVYWLRLEGNFNVNEGVLRPAFIHYRSLASFELYFDGQLLHKNGVVGATKNEEVPGYKHGQLILPRDLITSGPHVIALKISSHHWHKRGPLYRSHNVLIDLWINEHSELFSERLDRQFAVGFMAVNVFLACYYAILFIGNRRQVTHLCFSLLSVGMFLIGTFDNLHWIIDMPYHWDYPKFPLFAFSIIATSILLPLAFMLQFKTQHRRFWILGLLIYFGFCLTLVDKQHVGGWGIVGSFVCAILITSIAIFHKQSYAWLSLIGLILCPLGLLIENNYFYLSFSILSLLMLTGLTLQDRKQREKHHEIRLQASQFEAELLRKNIQPHFLMNSLTTILEWVEVQPEKAGQFIELLAEEFRLFNQISSENLISMDKEVTLCRLHLEVMGFRMQKVFKLDLENVNPDTLVPPAIFHTLVENGISHNSYDKQENHFTLKEKHEGDELIYEFLTPCNDISSENRNNVGTGVGTQYIESRLEQAFSGHWQLKASKVDNMWSTKIHIKSLMLKTNSEETDAYRYR